MPFEEQANEKAPSEELDEIAKDNLATLEAGREQGKKKFQAEAVIPDDKKLLSERRKKIFEEEEKVGYSIESLKQKAAQEKAASQENTTE